MSANEPTLKDIYDKLNQVIDPISWTYLNIQQVADYLKISTSQVRRLVTEGIIPYRRIPNGKAGKLLFNRKLIDVWLLTGSLRPTKRQCNSVVNIL